MDIPEVNFTTIPQYLLEISAYPNLCWIYRGQSNLEWPLKPKAGRTDYYVPKIDSPEDAELPPHDLRRFNYWRELAIAYHNPLPTNNFECLAFAQHYGLATRLLDWSTNPLVALFFAVDTCTDCDGAVFCHSPHGYIESDIADFYSFPFVGQYTPPPFDRRILNQCGVFTYHPNPSEALAVQDVDEDVRTLTPEHGLNLVRFRVMSKTKSMLKRQLDQIGINRKFLFPDLEGLSNFINWETHRSVNLSKRENQN